MNPPLLILPIVILKMIISNAAGDDGDTIIIFSGHNPALQRLADDCVDAACDFLCGLCDGPSKYPFVILRDSSNTFECGAAWVEGSSLINNKHIALAITSTNCINSFTGANQRGTSESYSLTPGVKELAGIPKNVMGTVKAANAVHFDGISDGLATVAFRSDKKFYKSVEHLSLPGKWKNEPKNKNEGYTYGIDQKGKVQFMKIKENAGACGGNLDESTFCVTVERFSYMSRDEILPRVLPGTPFIVAGYVYGVAARKSSTEGYIFMRFKPHVENVKATLKELKKALPKCVS